MKTDTFHVRTDHVPDCGRCGARTLLLARYPHAWPNAAGQQVAGLKETALCPICHQGQPAADELLTALQTDPLLGPRRIAELAGCIAAWVESERQRTVDLQALENEHKRWQHDEL